MTEFYENKHQKYFHEIFFYFISLNSLNTDTVQYIELFPGSGIIVPDPDPAKSERADKDK